MNISERAAEVMAATSVTVEEAARSVQVAMWPVLDSSCRDFEHMCQVIDGAQ